MAFPSWAYFSRSGLTDRRTDLRDSKARCSVETEVNSNDCRSALLSRHTRNAKCRMPFAVVKGRERDDSGRAQDNWKSILWIKFHKRAVNHKIPSSPADVTGHIRLNRFRTSDSMRRTLNSSQARMTHYTHATLVCGISIRDCSEKIRKHVLSGMGCKFQTMMIIDCQGLRQGDVLTRLLIYINRTDNTLKLLN